MLQKKIISLKVSKSILQSTPPPFPSPYVLCLQRKLVNFNFRWKFENLNFQGGWGIFSIPLTKHVTPKNEKFDLGILQHLEQLLGLGLGWVISAYAEP